MSDDDHLLHEILRELREIVRLLKRRGYYEVSIRRIDMAIGDIQAGSTGTFAAQLLDNGNPVSLPAGTVFSWSASDPGVLLETSADTLTTVATVPAGDTANSVTIVASTTDPNGQPVSGEITVHVSPAAQVFTVQVTQVS